MSTHRIIPMLTEEFISDNGEGLWMRDDFSGAYIQVGEKQYPVDATKMIDAVADYVRAQRIRDIENADNLQLLGITSSPPSG